MHGAERFIAGTASCRIAVDHVDELPARASDVLWGTIHPDNQPSLRNALSIGRTITSSVLWVTPADYPGMPPPAPTDPGTRATPNRFTSSATPKILDLPHAAWINPPTTPPDDQEQEPPATAA